MRVDVFEYHRGGKIRIGLSKPIRTREDLSLAYTPGVAEVSKRIGSEPELSFRYTFRGNSVAVVTDGSAVLGLGNIGPEAALPVMEGKCALFKKFADIDAVPLCVRGDVAETVKAVAPTFGGINLEDISAPLCFEVERKLENVGIPVMHDDQHGTAVVVLAGLLNALKLTGRSVEDASVVVNGAGAAGTAVTKLLAYYGFRDITVCDTRGAIYSGREGNTGIKEELASLTGRTEPGTLEEVLEGKNVFIGLSAPNVLNESDVRTMEKDPIIFALANPDPEIDPEAALRAGAAVVATGRSDYPNQINNALAFPGIFRGALDSRCAKITDGIKVAAAEAISSVAEGVIPDIFDPRVHASVAEAVARTAYEEGVAAVRVSENYFREVLKRISRE